MKPTRILPIVLIAALTGCGNDSADLAPIRLIHKPPVGQLTAQQLKELSMECEKYSPNNSMRGPYDAAYCGDAMAAWSDSPLQMIVVAPDAKPDTPFKSP